VETPEGEMIVSPGMYIVKKRDGRIEIMRKEVFESKYELMDEERKEKLITEEG
jgi:hypothetical protein